MVAASLWAQARADVPSNVDRPLIVFDTDIHGDYDDIGALATLHALADRAAFGDLPKRLTKAMRKAFSVP